MDKIAILSMQRVVNFGSVLQAYSLREILKEITGCQATFLDIDATAVLACVHKDEKSADYGVPAAYPPGLLQRGKRWLIAKLSARNKVLIRRFMRQELALDAKAEEEHYDCVVVGSDEVLNHSRGVNLQLHGDVKNSRKVITYAASCGSATADGILPEDRERVRSAMRHYSAVSVRDAATEQYALALYEGPIERHIDPVLAGNLHQRAHRPVRLKNYLLVYAYGQRIRTAEEINAIRSFAKAKGLKTVAVGGSQFWCDMYIPTTPFRLMDYFYYADYVVTDTFHGIIFSVINQKKFAVIPRKTNWTKVTGLLQDLKLEHRKIDQMSQLECVLPDSIDYPQVEAILGHERIRTRAYLKKQLEG